MFLSSGRGRTDDACTPTHIAHNSVHSGVQGAHQQQGRSRPHQPARRPRLQRVSSVPRAMAHMLSVPCAAILLALPGTILGIRLAAMQPLVFAAQGDSGLDPTHALILTAAPVGCAGGAAEGDTVPSQPARRPPAPSRSKCCVEHILLP